MSDTPDSDLARFRWSKPAGGYRWVQGDREQDARAEVDWLLEEIPDGEVGGPRQAVELLREQAVLFREFAALDPFDRDGMRQFANEYGWLGFYAPRPHLANAYGYTDLDGRASSRRRGFRETYPSWQRAIFWMKWAVRVADARANGDLSSLRPHFVGRHFRTDPGAGISRDVPPAIMEMRVPLEHPSDGTGIPDEFVLASRFIERSVNEHLGRYSAAGVICDPPSGRCGIHIVPTNLLGAMWYQLARFVAENRDHRTCRQCKGWFEISSEWGGRAAKREFCNDACKSREYRIRRDRARALAAEGKKLSQVCHILNGEGLGTDRSTVKKWIATER